jgi:hypothetical protein
MLLSLEELQFPQKDEDALEARRKQRRKDQKKKAKEGGRKKRTPPRWFRTAGGDIRLIGAGQSAG